MEEKEFLSTTELARILGITRAAIHKKIKKGEIHATKIGRNYIIARKELGGVLGTTITPQRKAELTQAVQRTIKEYGETLRLLGRE